MTVPHIWRFEFQLRHDPVSLLRLNVFVFCTRVEHLKRLQFSFVFREPQFFLSSGKGGKISSESLKMVRIVIARRGLHTHPKKDY